jgi:hypothetical protein
MPAIPELLRDGIKDGLKKLVSLAIVAAVTLLVPAARHFLLDVSAPVWVVVMSASVAGLSMWSLARWRTTMRLEAQPRIRKLELAVLPPTPAPAALTKPQRIILGLARSLDGRALILPLLEKAGLGRLEADQAIDRLVDLGLVRRVAGSMDTLPSVVLTKPGRDYVLNAGAADFN